MHVQAEHCRTQKCAAHYECFCISKLIKNDGLMVRVELATFFAPVAYVDHMTSPIAWIAPFSGFVDVSTLWPRSYDASYIVGYYMIWAKTS